jgi:hypothetical protein
VSKSTLTTCDGCNASTVASYDVRSAAGWRNIRVAWSNAGGAQTSRSFDVCPDELCAARAVDFTRAARPLHLVGAANHPSKAAD